MVVVMVPEWLEESPFMLAFWQRNSFLELTSGFWPVQTSTSDRPEELLTLG